MVDWGPVTVTVLLAFTVLVSVTTILTNTPQVTDIGSPLLSLRSLRGTRLGRFPASTFARADGSRFRSLGADDAGTKPGDVGTVVVVPLPVMVTPTVKGSATVMVTVFVTATVGWNLSVLVRVLIFVFRRVTVFVASTTETP